jgi:hypothetical protein
MASEVETIAAERRGSEERSRSPARGEASPANAGEGSPMELANLPEHGPSGYTYHHGPEANFMSGPLLPASHSARWDPRGGGSFSMRLPTPAPADTMMAVPPEAVPGGTNAASSASNGNGNGGLRAGGAAGGAAGGSAGGAAGSGDGGGGYPAWDNGAVQMQPFPGSSPVTVRFAEVVHWRQRVVYCSSAATVDGVKWAMRHIVGQNVSTFRINDGFSGHPLARHWHVTDATPNGWPNFSEPRRILVVMPSFM